MLQAIISCWPVHWAEGKEGSFWNDLKSKEQKQE